MYLRKIEIENVRCIKKLTWEIPEGKEAGWHVILGDNGSGKTSVLRAIALCLIGKTQAGSVPMNPVNMITQGCETADIRLTVCWDQKYDFTPQKPAGSSVYTLTIHKQPQRGTYFTGNGIGLDHIPGNPLLEHNPGWLPGWFSASFGPFRRFTGRDKEQLQSFPKDSRVFPHLSLFNENVAFWSALEWLQDIQFKSLEGRQDAQHLIVSIKKLVNQAEFLPNNVTFVSVSSDDVEFIDSNGYKLPVEQLSDGYRSVLSLTFELIRQLTIRYGSDKIFAKTETGKIIIDVPGVVLIDEADAHLHPSWQREIGFRFREHFPQMQFIVTTHSPLICQTASQGSVFRLPEPGSDEPGRMLQGTELERVVYGNVQEAYSTEAFGSIPARSDESNQFLERLAELNLKELNKGLNKKERAEQNRLRAMFPTSPYETQ